MLLSLGSGTFCQATTLLHPSRGDGSNCPTRWSQLSDKVVLIVRQSFFFCWNKLVVKFVEIIGLINLVEKWVDNLGTKLSEKFSLTFMLKI